VNSSGDNVRASMLSRLRRLSAPSSALPHLPVTEKGLEPGVSMDLKVRETVPDEALNSLPNELKRLGGEFRMVASPSDLPGTILQLARESHYKRIAVSSDSVLNEANVVARLHDFRDFKIILSDRAPFLEGLRLDAFMNCQLGITGCEAVIADTATIVLNHAAFGGRLISLLPECHVVVARCSQVFSSLEDWMNSSRFSPGSLPACMTLITGPSRTADIEKVLVTGVHGPLRLVLMMLQHPA
jgi:L-lactate utilization protein LutC